MITIGGTVGVGKSTLTACISKHFNSPAFYESVEDNPILEDFYADKKRWAFPLQIYFLNTRFQMIKDAIATQNPYAVLDRSIHEDKLFTQMNFSHGNMSMVEMHTYNALFDNMMDEWTGVKKRPELFIYLHASFETILERMKKRGRAFELTKKDIAYFEDLHDKYTEWIKTYNASAILFIDMDKYDLTIPEHEKFVMEVIEHRMATILAPSKNNDFFIDNPLVGL